MGTNSLTDLLVFGKASGDTTIRFLEENPTHKDLPGDAADMTLERLSRLDGRDSGESVHDAGNELRQVMQMHCGVFRFPDLLDEGVRWQLGLRRLRLWRMARIWWYAGSAYERVKGQSDFPERDDENWIKHTLWYKENSRLEYKPVHMKPLSAETIEPKVRTY